MYFTSLFGRAVCQIPRQIKFGWNLAVGSIEISDFGADVNNRAPLDHSVFTKQVQLDQSTISGGVTLLTWERQLMFHLSPLQQCSNITPYMHGRATQLNCGNCKRELSQVLWLLKDDQIAVLIFRSVGLSSSVCIETGYGMDWHRIKCRWEATFPVLSWPVLWPTDSLSRVKEPRCGVDRSPH